MIDQLSNNFVMARWLLNHCLYLRYSKAIKVVLLNTLSFGEVLSQGKGVINVAQKKGGKNQKLKEKDKRKLLARAKQKIEAQQKS